MSDLHNQAKFGSQNVPHRIYEDLTPGPTATITMINTGYDPWGVAGDPNPFYLRSLNPPGNDNWGVVQVSPPYVIGSGQPCPFTIPLDNLSLPPRHGYNFQWQMYREGVGYFGDPTPNVVIDVEISNK